MPTSAAPSFSLATARIALPVSVKVISSHSASATTKTATKPTTRGTARNVDAEIDRLEGVRHVDGARIGAERRKQRVLDDDGEAERHQQDVAIVAVRRPGR